MPSPLFHRQEFKKTRGKGFYHFLLIMILLVAAPVIGVGENTVNSDITITVRVDSVFQSLLAEEDTDDDNRITVEDTFLGDARGDEVYTIVDTAGRFYEISGTYYLSNLLKELTLLRERGEEFGTVGTARIFEDPVHRISRSIRQRYWDGLTRSIDEEGLVSILRDTKTQTVDGYHYLYVPPTDTMALQYFKRVADEHSDLKLRVVQLPPVITPSWVESRDGYHGLLTLKLVRRNGEIEGIPFVVPGGRFNEMYGWDSYFEALGLLEDGRVDLARGMVEHFIYEIRHYGKILNANRSYYLTRSQPPFLTSMALAVYEHLPGNENSKEWLKRALRAAIHEYRTVWTTEPRLTESGLSRYYGKGVGPPPEVEEGHFDQIYRRFAEDSHLSPEEFENRYKEGLLHVPALDTFFIHDRAMRESGHDKTYRWDNACANFVTVDLNSLLYKYEIDIARTIRDRFGDTLRIANGETVTSDAWFQKAERRKELMNKYLWDGEHGLFYDYNFVTGRRNPYMNATVFYPLWAGVATESQAESTVANALPVLEQPGGVVASSRESRGPLSRKRPARQWDYPYGWAPHQMLIWKGLQAYGYKRHSRRLAYRWLYTITRNAVDYNGIVPEKFNVVTRSHRVFAEYGNVGTEFAYITREGFGWMNASYQVGLTYLSTGLQERLNRLIPPEWVFGKE